MSYAKSNNQNFKIQGTKLGKYKFILISISVLKKFSENGFLFKDPASLIDSLELVLENSKELI